MINPITLIEELYEATQAGKEMADAKAWSDKSHAAAMVTAAISAVVTILGMFHVIPADLVIDPETIKSVALGIASAGVLVVNFLHTASNRNAGRTSKLQG
jgi:hypothetical protein